MDKVEETKVEEAKVEETKTEADKGDKGEKSLPEPLPGDWLLRKLVDLVNHVDVRIGITLCVQGMLVSGDLVGGETYLKQLGHNLSEGFSTATGGKGDGGFKEELSRMAERVYAKDRVPAPPEYVHLVDTRIFSPGGEPIPNNQGMLFRARIAEVGAFSVGKLARQAEE